MFIIESISVSASGPWASVGIVPALALERSKATSSSDAASTERLSLPHSTARRAAARPWHRAW